MAIHQPNFFPWLGNFDKMVKSNVYIFLDHVQFPKTGGVWPNRVKLLIGMQAAWLTAPIVRNYHGVRAITEMAFQSDVKWRGKMVKTIHGNYSKAPFYQECMALVEPLIMNPENNIASYNSHVVLSIVEKLGTSSSKFYRSSELSHQGHSNELLISLTRSVGGDTYLCGGGADAYQDETVFSENNVILKYQNFKHPEYPQMGSPEFIPGLSIIDALMNLGWDGVNRLLHKGV